MLEQLGQLTKELVSIDSINPDLVPGASGEQRIAEFVAHWLTARGVSVRLEEVCPGRPNVIAVVPGRGEGRTLMLNGHLDTVGVAGMSDPFGGKISEARLYGRGAYDMKASIAMCMLAVAWASQQSLAGDVLFTAVMDEEYAGLGSLDIAQRYQADAAIVTEPTGFDLVIAHKGFVWLEIESKGVAAHGSRPDLGQDAIIKMGRVLIELEKLNARLLAGPGHRLLGTGSLHASLIEGGQELSSYPERCLLSVERRTIPGETAETVHAEMESLLRRVSGEQSGLGYEMRLVLDRAPMETSEEETLPKLIRRATSSVEGREARIAGMSGWTDAASLAEAGIPAVLFGPDGQGAHATEEWVDLNSVVDCLMILQQVILAFCG